MTILLALLASAWTIDKSGVSLAGPVAEASKATEKPQDAWRSSLYPVDWKPGFADSEGRFLHDFSYAGYHAGEKSIPDISTNILDVTQNPYQADPSGRADATAGIQAAIDDAGKAGGGVVYLPAGVYRIAPPASKNEALLINYDNVVLRGAGPGKTFILNDEIIMRGKCVIRVSGRAGFNWYPKKEQNPVAITADLPLPTKVIPLADVSAFKPGDRVLLHADLTDAFVAELGMTGKWQPGKNSWGLEGTVFYRIVTAVDAAERTITIDAPTRHYLLKRDQARVLKTADPTREVGLESFSLGMREHPDRDDRLVPGTTWGEKLSDGWLNKPGTMAYEVHGSTAIHVVGVENGWIRNVSTYRPDVNKTDVHILSNGLVIKASRFVTVRDCTIEKPEYEGGGGNGYGYTTEGQDCLLVDCKAIEGRHNYDFKSMASCGNVLLRCQAIRGRMPSDFHQYLSGANLFDSTLVDNDQLEARYRPYAVPEHGQSTTQSVFWNTRGLAYQRVNPFDPNSGRRPVIVNSQQYGWGYVIGTSGPANAVAAPGGNGTEPVDFVEGGGRGESLVPSSLYVDQFFRRTGRLPQ